MSGPAGRRRAARRFFGATGPSYDQVARLATLGADLWWKRRILASLPPRPGAILEQACGTGILTAALARRHPGARILALDQEPGYLAVARAKLDGAARVELVLGRAEELCPPGPWDCVVSSYLAKYADLPRLAANCRRLLRPGGRLVMHDFTLPPGPLYRRAWEAHFRLLQAAGGRLWPRWRHVFHELPGLLRASRWVPELLGALAGQGFRRIRVMRLTFGSAALVTAQAPPAPGTGR